MRTSHTLPGDPLMLIGIAAALAGFVFYSVKFYGWRFWRWPRDWWWPS
ncbi:hypothetical protein [Lacipirellula parvula]|uniref:Uncharacterized protein n=1 Tax=Lacipirellula parvula TaxID=2650471 RepID=A0A5K7X2G4_9BACT|nr:hypothetical protein [Lacipirellula parvula]BBO30838.1 hypothetical protein PLANPX_0450 [Lacipirellula parvula]